MDISPYSNASAAKEMRRRVHEARQRFESMKLVFMPHDLAQLVEERLSELSSSIDIFLTLARKDHDAGRQLRLYKCISWGLSNLMIRTPWPKDRHNSSDDTGGSKKRERKDPMQEMAQIQHDAALSEAIAQLGRNPGRPSQGREVMLCLDLLPHPDSPWDLSFCKRVSNLTSFDLMVRLAVCMHAWTKCPKLI